VTSEVREKETDERVPSCSSQSSSDPPPRFQISQGASGGRGRYERRRKRSNRHLCSRKGSVAVGEKKGRNRRTGRSIRLNGSHLHRHCMSRLLSMRERMSISSSTSELLTTATESAANEAEPKVRSEVAGSA
jgi:hypothetical protein